MNRSIVICDDEPESLLHVTAHLKKFEQETGEKLDLLTFTSGEAMLADWPKKADVLILDVRMGGVSGLEAARELRSRGDKVRIIFLTSLPQYALEGYEVQAYSFLLKPVLYATLADKLKGIFRLMDEETGKVLKLKNNRGITLIPVKSIIYAESQKHNVILVHENGRDIFQLAMKDLEEQVGGGFFRCHKGYIVNLCMVSQIGPEFLIMGNGDRVPVSRHRRADFIRYFRAYMGDRLCG